MGDLHQIPVGTRVKLHVPATSANIGPGFDALGLALGLYDDVEVQVADEGFHAEISGEGEGLLPTDGRHLILAEIQAHLNQWGFEAPGLQLKATNRIPHSRGLGSSSAANVTAVLAADAMLPAESRHSAEQLLNCAARLEGHPDNVAPTLSGGVALSWKDADNAATEESDPFHSVTLVPHQDITPVVAIPKNPLSTEAARELLPADISHQEATVNASRAALLTHALAARPDILLPATEDHLHQEFRRPAMPESLGLMDKLRAQGWAAVISGAGPTVMALGRSAEEALVIEASMLEMIQESAQHWDVVVLPVAQEGARIEVSRGN